MPSLEITDFGRKLAHTDKKERDIAVKQLISYLCSLESLSLEESCKLWKGLYYCFWMSDKTKVQHHLAQILASVVSTIPPSHAYYYLKGFWVSMAKEWHGIDRIRLNKFYFLMRKFQSTCFQMMMSSNWDKDFVTPYATILRETVLIPNDSSIPHGIQYHLIETTFTELNEVCSSVPQEILFILLDPFIQLGIKSSNSIILDRLKTELFEKLILDTEFKLQINPIRICNLIYSATITESIQPKNQKYLETLIKEYLMKLNLEMEDVINYTNIEITSKEPESILEKRKTIEDEEKTSKRGKIEPELSVDKQQTLIKSEDLDPKSLKWNSQVQVKRFEKKKPVSSSSVQKQEGSLTPGKSSLKKIPQTFKSFEVKKGFNVIPIKSKKSIKRK